MPLRSALLARPPLLLLQPAPHPHLSLPLTLPLALPLALPPSLPPPLCHPRERYKNRAQEARERNRDAQDALDKLNRTLSSHDAHNDMEEQEQALRLLEGQIFKLQEEIEDKRTKGDFSQMKGECITAVDSINAHVIRTISAMPAVSLTQMAGQQEWSK